MSHRNEVSDSKTQFHAHFRVRMCVRKIVYPKGLTLRRMARLSLKSQENI
jgi:hypothetical protein